MTAIFLDDFWLLILLSVVNLKNSLSIEDYVYIYMTFSPEKFDGPNDEKMIQEKPIQTVLIYDGLT